MIMRLSLSFLLLTATNAGATITCRPENLCAIMRPILRDDGVSVTKPYAFRYRAPSPGQPTVVIIPGGPGQPSTDWDSGDRLGVPPTWGYLLTDPRFVGANRSSDVERFKESLTSENVAADIALAIRELNIQNYFVFGESYGTMVATILGARLPAPGPRAIVLQGTVGRAFGIEESLQPYRQAWDEYLASRPGLRESMVKRRRQLIDAGGISADDFDNFVGLVLATGRRENGSSATHFFDLFLGDDTALAIRVAKVIAEVERTSNEPRQKYFHRVLTCKETTRSSQVFDGGFDGETLTLVVKAIGSCADYVKSVHLYDSREYQVRYPLVYVQGLADVATPMVQARAHYDGQLSAPSKLMLAITNGSHGPIEAEGKACAPGFWRALGAGDRATLPFSLAACQR